MWTVFKDMSSGGSQKLEYNVIAIEAPENAAKWIFKDLFDRDPDNTSCSTCGSDYVVDEYETKQDMEGNVSFWKGSHGKEFIYTADQFTESQKALVIAMPILNKVQ